MTPLNQCIRRIQAASTQADSASIEEITEALEVFEAAHSSAREQILALETVFQFFKHRCRDQTCGDFMRQVSMTIDRYQDQVIARSAFGRKSA